MLPFCFDVELKPNSQQIWFKKKEQVRANHQTTR